MNWAPDYIVGYSRVVGSSWGFYKVLQEDEATGLVLMSTSLVAKLIMVNVPYSTCSELET